MGNLNKVLLMGRLTRDPQQRFIPSGQGVVEFAIAINRNYTTNGEKREEVTFVDLEAWGQSGDLIMRYMKKGNPIFVEGRLKLDSWTSKEGEKRSRMRVVVDRFQFVGSAAGGQGGGRQAGGEEGFEPQDFGVEPRTAGAGGAMEGGADDVPF